MAEDEQVVDFIPAWDDAQLRLQCYKSVAHYGLDASLTLEAAKALYAWTMGDEDDETVGFVELISNGDILVHGAHSLRV